MNRVINNQDLFWVPKRFLIYELKSIKKVVGFADWDVGLHLLNNQQIQLMNKQYRSKDKPTDVLSFPFNEISQPGKLSMISNDQVAIKDLGDIFLSLEYAISSARATNVNNYDWIRVLLVHSICHLLGYDHIKDSDYLIVSSF
ncbi:putative ribonuclease [Smittium mucronatum]|uniref:Putative ribonuclease n=1 Tax=Smittium mucronatum TaxID=133383 RepID=A0A1R0H934_9FUNG|nr:putative ribonuclease [Smittium mucronatum]